MCTKIASIRRVFGLMGGAGGVGVAGRPKGHDGRARVGREVVALDQLSAGQRLRPPPRAQAEQSLLWAAETCINDLFSTG